MSNQNICEVCDTRGATVYHDEGHYCASCYNEYKAYIHCNNELENKLALEDEGSITNAN